MTGKARVLIFIVAYEAESTLASVLERIPPAVFTHETEVLVIDDSSSDRTFETGVKYLRKNREFPVTVLYNPENQGYGGNQKLGYRYAIRKGFDHVVLLHGDGQYAPEKMADLLRPLLEGEADAVMGSRMLERGGALKGGMPLYKFVGNKILSTFQRLFLRADLSEFHSGYRAYRVRALADLPFQYNSNDFHFDTEIIIQLLRGGKRIVEVPIPTYYGDEICRVNGLKYARDVLVATTMSLFHQVNLLYDRKYDIAGDTNVVYDLKLGYPSSHTLALEEVPAESRVLDIGCGPGGFAGELKKKGCEVTGVDGCRPPSEEPFSSFVLWRDESEPAAGDLSGYDSVLMLDIVEHLRKPELVLENLRRAAGTSRPKFVVTTGNVAFLVVRLQLLLGAFNYGKKGILDLTHTRLYTFRSLPKLFRQCGFVVEKVVGIPAPFPKALGDNVFSSFLLALNRLAIKVLKGVFSYQIFLVARPSTTVDALLDVSVRSSRERERRIPEDR